MKPPESLLFMMVIPLMTTALYSQSIPGKADEELLKEFQLQTEKWKEAYNSQDAQNLVPLYWEDALYISSHVKGLEARGRERVIANFQNGMDMGGYIDAVEILTMQISCDLATLHCQYQATNNGVCVLGRNLLVMRKINGVWQIILHMTVV
jgi:ketosteroid isomerase-like protein